MPDVPAGAPEPSRTRPCHGASPLQGYSEVGGMERHYAMEYFAKLHMEVGTIPAGAAGTSC